MRKVSDIWIATTIGFFSAFRDARKKGHELIRAGGQGGHLQPILSAVGQKRPLVVEIKGFKTGHFWEQKSAPLDLGRYGPEGQVELSKLLKVSCRRQFTVYTTKVGLSGG